MQVTLVINCTYRKVQKPLCNHTVQVVLFKKGSASTCYCHMLKGSLLSDI